MHTCGCVCMHVYNIYDASVLCHHDHSIDFGKRAFAYIVSNVWITLPPGIKFSTSYQFYQTFKCCLRRTYSAYPTARNLDPSSDSRFSSADSVCIINAYIIVIIIFITTGSRFT